MIKTDKKNNKFDQIKSIQILFEGVSFAAHEDLKSKAKELFKGKQIDFVYYLDRKKYPEDYQKSVHTTYLCRSDFSFFKKIKDPNIKASVLDKKHDLLLVSAFKTSKNSNKLISLKKVDITIGAERETLPNFDISFMLEKDDHEALMRLVVKYLKNV